MNLPTRTHFGCWKTTHSWIFIAASGGDFPGLVACNVCAASQRAWRMRTARRLCASRRVGESLRRDFSAIHGIYHREKSWSWVGWYYIDTFILIVLYGQHYAKKSRQQKRSVLGGGTIYIYTYYNTWYHMIYHDNVIWYFPNETVDNRFPNGTHKYYNLDYMG